MSRILIVGTGGREYAVIKKLSQSRHNLELFYVGPNQNPGMNMYGSYLGQYNLVDCKKIVNIAKAATINMAFIGPEVALFAGIVDEFNLVGIHVIGPTKQMAQIETSKTWARQLVQKVGLDAHNPRIYGIFNKCMDINDIKISLMGIGEFVVKPDGLHSGKGVKVFGVDFTTCGEAAEYIHSILEEGETVIVEERLYGKEFSLMSFTDGVHCAHMIPVKDFKRAYENDKGPNTGSMGSITGCNGKLSFLTDNDLTTCHHINNMIISTLKTYSGVIYGSFMKTTDGIKIIEFNARFGDPESINVLHLMKNDLYEIFDAIVNSTVNKINLEFSDQASVFKYKVPIGYPDKVNSGSLIKLPNSQYNGLIYAGISEIDDQYVTTGSRTVGIIETDKTLESAAKKVNLNLDMIKGKLYYRQDIGFGMNYRNAGVNIEEGNRVIKQIRSLVEATYNQDVVSKFGDFSGMIKIGDNILVASTDGVGTKSILVLETYGPIIGYEMLGHDIVNHCVNDTLVKGAAPIFFLDYFAANKLDATHTVAFVKGISEACISVGCVLLGGETAEMPDVYQEGYSDVVGTMVGIVNEKNVINGKDKIKEGDVILGLPSSGPHTNGYTLIRKILSTLDSKEYSHMLPALCATHKCYFDDVQQIKLAEVDIHGLCHITGGGFIDNPPRILPDGLDINWLEIPFSPLFKWLQERGEISDQEMKQVFNCGIGMLVFIDPNDLAKFPKLNEVIIGYVVSKIVEAE
jgi:phosphoribosylamine--glycine ligase/phosphoribosylaminoimidazole synthetase